MRARMTNHFHIRANNGGLEEAAWCSGLKQIMSLCHGSTSKNGVRVGALAIPVLLITAELVYPSVIPISKSLCLYNVTSG